MITERAAMFIMHKRPDTFLDSTAAVTITEVTPDYRMIDLRIDRSAHSGKLVDAFRDGTGLSICLPGSELFLAVEGWS